jgi:hypothetical protein
MNSFFLHDPSPCLSHDKTFFPDFSFLFLFECTYISLIQMMIKIVHLAVEDALHANKGSIIIILTFSYVVVGKVFPRLEIVYYRKRMSRKQWKYYNRHLSNSHSFVCKKSSTGMFQLCLSTLAFMNMIENFMGTPP